MHSIEGINLPKATAGVALAPGPRAVPPHTSPPPMHAPRSQALSALTALLLRPACVGQKLWTVRISGHQPRTPKSRLRDQECRSLPLLQNLKVYGCTCSVPGFRTEQH